ncbi:MAG: hypothetical protein DME48_11130 [Verrucomicrobia bacterium]|nr:MAG: hypothetical protein DME48_11130 [Verrucomicrobiota bacterium]
MIHFADQPRDRAEQEGDAAVKLRRNRKYWNRRQPKRPPNRMKAGAEICTEETRPAAAMRKSLGDRIRKTFKM